MELAYVRVEGKLMLACSLASILTCASILITFVVFPRLLRRSYMLVVCYVTASDLVAAVGSVLGEPESGSIPCWFLGIVTNIFTLSSILWTVVSVLIIFSVVKGREYRIGWVHHLVCWMLPVSVTLLPLINMTYGRDEPGWCWIINTDSSPPWAETFWSWVNFYGIVWGSMFIVIVLFGMLFFEIYSSNELHSRPAVKKIFTKLQLYPVIIAVCWGLTCFYDLAYISGTYARGEVYFDATVAALPCLQGFFSCVLFWFVNGDVILMWHQYIYKNRRVGSKSRFSSMLSKAQIQSQYPGEGEPVLGDAMARVRPINNLAGQSGGIDPDGEFEDFLEYDQFTRVSVGFGTERVAPAPLDDSAVLARPIESDRNKSSALEV